MSFYWEILGTAHNNYNLNRKYGKLEFSIFHNRKCYAAQFIIQELPNTEQIEQINIIPKNEKNYIACGFNNLKYVDSISFMNPDDSL